MSFRRQEKSVQVVDHGPQAWLLFKDGDELLLDVNCSHSAAGYSVLIHLEADEAAAYAQEGRTYLDRLAQRVQDSGPGSGLQSRDVSARFSNKCTEAFEKWRAAS